MKTFNILLVEASSSIKPQLEESLRSIQNEAFKIVPAKPSDAEDQFRKLKKNLEVVLFGDKVPVAVVLRLTKHFRKQSPHLHVLVLTRQSEARPSAQMKHAGVDDFLNVMELNTPVFGWTFQSLLLHTGMRKKAAEYEEIQERLQEVNRSLHELSREMGNPIGNIRAAVKALNGHQQKVSVILKKNIALMEEQLRELFELGNRLGKETKVINKFLAVKSRT